MMAKVRRALGLMSGTSMDGIDLAVIETDGQSIASFEATAFRPYADDERKDLRAALIEARDVAHRDERGPAMARAEETVTRAHVEVVLRFLREHRLSASAIDVIGFHGQTVFHAPQRGLSVQLGDAEALADAVGIALVTDMRIADIVAGGQGAPLVPVYHRALSAYTGLEGPLAVVNIGGVANATWIGSDANDLIAFDTGPGNALIDDFVQERGAGTMDCGGAFAAAGTVDRKRLERWLANPYFGLKAPKSIDRDAFSRDGLETLSLEDGCATLTAFTANSIVQGLSRMPTPARHLVVVGGGARNPTLLAMLEGAAGVPVRSGDAVGWSADFVEAQAFAFLAVRSMEGLPLTFPGTTGVPASLSGGRVISQ